MTAAHVCDESMTLDVAGVPAVVVEGHDRLSGAGLCSLEHGESPFVDDWVLLATDTERLAPNAVDFEYRPSRGQEVLVGGYFLGSAREASTRFSEPRVITGRVSNAKPQYPNEEGTVFIKVTPGDYRGFSGGPVASRDGDGHLRVWGMFVASCASRPPDQLHDLLIVAPLPKTLALLANKTIAVEPHLMGVIPQPVVEQHLQVLSAMTVAGPVSAIPVDAHTVLMAGGSLRGGVLAAVIDGRPWTVVGDPQHLARVLMPAAAIDPADDWVLLGRREDRYPPVLNIDPDAEPTPLGLALVTLGELHPNVIDAGATPGAGERVILAGFRQPDAGNTANEPERVVVEGTMEDRDTTQSGSEVAAVVLAPPGDYSGFLGGPAAVVDANGDYRVWGVIVRCEPPDADGKHHTARLTIAPLDTERIAREPRDIPRVLHRLGVRQEQPLTPSH
ncbi:MAG: trypsin-like peptidase domain-containing protein [Phycisphaerae bacterium]|nr:trypsin-like peptidase domain-containing protein [Phycisphaerae bacterium]